MKIVRCVMAVLAAMAMLLVGVFPFMACAQMTDETSSLTVLFSPDGSPATSMVFHLYCVARVDGEGQVLLTDPFMDLPVDFDTADPSRWEQLSFTLENYTVAQGVAPDATAVVNSAGAAMFEELSRGVYLGIGEAYHRENTVYTPQSFLVTLPYTDDRGDQQDSLTVEPKYSVTTTSVTDLAAVKVWNDGDGTGRPTKVVVQLYRDQQLFDTVTLTGENNWRYVWEDLDAHSSWHLTEVSVDSDTFVTIQREGNCFVVTNTRNTPLAPDEPTLPQTGVLWWPVPLCIVAGLALIFFGWRVLRKDS